MPEVDTIHADQPPLTVSLLAEQFAACGLAAGQTVVVHTAMSKLGWVVGGAVAVIEALTQVLGSDGTLMMPTHTSENSEPSYWQHPPVPETWWQVIRDHMPAYDPALTPTREMGRVAELFRTQPGVARSAHPATSFAARGRHAAYLTSDHAPENRFAPLEKLYELDGHVLLIGVGHGNNTSLHLCEQRAEFPSKHSGRQGAAMLVNGARRWVEYEVKVLDGDDDFPPLGDSYEGAHDIPRHRVGMAEVRFMKQRPLVDYGVGWIAANRR